ncbi:MAG TPA: cysteine desulfurase [Candidatus Onthousia faecigallinarum]|nr:cysteine desulfurase [Candidatus Onthousia faecigallinarum]
MREVKKMNRDDFPFLNQDIVYFDNGATSLKPECVLEAMDDYYRNYPANIHRGDYAISLKASNAYEEVRNKVAKFIGAESPEEIVFTSGATDGMNKIVFGFMQDYLNEGDEVLLTKAEHASNVLPWFELERTKKIKIRYIPLNENYELELEAVKEQITEKTKVISLAEITNVIGDIRPIHEIGELCQEKNILLVVDGAQSVPHKKTDVLKDHIDFLVFSAHKMLGPTGVGVLYGKKEYLEALRPLEYGGGMNQSFDSDGTVEYKSIPTRLEAGTPPIAEVIGLGKAIDYLEEIGMDHVFAYEKELKKYLVSQLEQLDSILLYNTTSESGALAFNIDGVFSQDTAIYLDHYHICVRAGNHCAKVLKEEMNIKNTCRVSLYFYNTKEEIDRFIEVLKKSSELYKIIL